MEQAEIGIIGGSGLYDVDELTERTAAEMRTPFGQPSAPLVFGTIGGRRVAFLARHGAGHTIAPSQVNYRANIHSMKQAGVRFILAVSACGSLREEIAPGTAVIPDQLVDFTRGARKRSFFDSGMVVHTGVADPFCPYMRSVLLSACAAIGNDARDGARFVTVEGPRFSTRGESALFRTWNMDIIGMTTSPEAFLAREAEISYAVLAHVTDYDVWHGVPVSNDEVVRTFQNNIRETRAAVVQAVSMIEPERETAAHRALDGALMTKVDVLTSENRERYARLLDRFL